MPTLSWGNPMAGSSEDARAAPSSPAAQVSQDSGDDDKSLSLSAVRESEESKMGITEPVGRFAAPVAQPARVYQEAPVEQAANQMGIPTMNWNRPVPQESMAERAALAAVAAPVVQAAPEPVEQAAPVVQAAPVSDFSSWKPPVESRPNLGMTSYHSHMSSYRMNMHADDA